MSAFLKFFTISEHDSYSIVKGKMYKGSFVNAKLRFGKLVATVTTR